ncbi:MAG: TerB family tellurite resistance protein [Rubrobacter sp.]|jgi:uncharacterized tellurite resistance protein B-like protein|nr:TerB family tellurite resistance protein [Rubrobacter sp.]
MKENDGFALKELSDEQRVAFYGSLFAIAAADGQIQREELELIYEMIDTDGLEDESRRQLYAYAIEPPALKDCLENLADVPEEVRFGLMLNLVEVTAADRLSLQEEKNEIAYAQSVLRVGDEQLTAMKDAAEKMRYVRERGIDDNHAADVLKSAASGMSAVGVPILAVAYSGSVAGLSAAGISSGLAAVGLGLGMVPGIGVAVLIGAGIFIGVNALLDTGNKRKKEAHKSERERKAQLAIQNLQETINHLISRITEMQVDAADAKANKEAIEQLNERLRNLQRILIRRKEDLAEGA